MVFHFDRELFVSKVYERVLRGFAKNSIRRRRELDTGLGESSGLRMTKSELTKQMELPKSFDRKLEQHLVVGVDMGMRETGT